MSGINKLFTNSNFNSPDFITSLDTPPEKIQKASHNTNFYNTRSSKKRPRQEEDTQGSSKQQKFIHLISPSSTVVQSTQPSNPTEKELSDSVSEESIPITPKPNRREKLSLKQWILEQCKGQTKTVSELSAAMPDLPLSSLAKTVRGLFKKSQLSRERIEKVHPTTYQYTTIEEMTSVMQNQKKKLGELILEQCIGQTRTVKELIATIPGFTFKSVSSELKNLFNKGLLSRERIEGVHPITYQYTTPELIPITSKPSRKKERLLSQSILEQCIGQTKTVSELSAAMPDFTAGSVAVAVKNLFKKNQLSRERIEGVHPITYQYTAIEELIPIAQNQKKRLNKLILEQCIGQAKTVKELSAAIPEFTFKSVSTLVKTLFDEGLLSRERTNRVRYSPYQYTTTPNEFKQGEIKTSSFSNDSQNTMTTTTSYFSDKLASEEEEPSSLSLGNNTVSEFHQTDNPSDSLHLVEALLEQCKMGKTIQELAQLFAQSPNILRTVENLINTEQLFKIGDTFYTPFEAKVAHP